MVKSKLPDVEIPDVPLHEAIFFSPKWEEIKDMHMLVDGISGRSYTFSEVRRISNNVAAVLKKRGLKKGDMLAIVCHNCPEFAFMVYGCMLVGVIVTTVNPAYTVYELRHQVKDSGATFIFASEDAAAKAKTIAAELVQIKEIFVTGSSPGCTPFHNLIEYTGPEFDPFSVQFNPAADVVFMPYSSGTTGLPKGVLITHKNALSVVIQTSVPEFNIPQQDKKGQPNVLGLTPFFHIYGLVLVLCAVPYRGSMITILPKFSPATFLSAMEKYRVSRLYLAPPTALFMTKSPMVKNYDLSSLKNILCGGAPLDRDTEIELAQMLKDTSITQGYGMTEASPSVLMTPLLKPKPGSSGILIPNTEVVIMDLESGKVQGPYQRGELWVRGPQVVKGYHNRPEETRKTFDADGWLHTGDIAYYDKDGYFYIVDRIKDLIKVKGFQVAPAELEALMLTHPQVFDVGVTSVLDERAGELPMAYVVKKPHASITEKEILHFVADRTVSYKHLKGGVEFIDEIPKLPSGKIIRRALQERARSKTNKSRL